MLPQTKRRIQKQPLQQFLLAPNGLILKAASVEHLDAFWEMVEASKSLDWERQVFWRAINSKEEAREYLEEIDFNKTNADEYPYFILANNELVGTFHIMSIRWNHERAEMGCYITPEAARIGYAFTAVRLAENSLFKIGFARIEMHCRADNVAANKICLKLGYKKDGVLREYTRIGGRLYDIAVYSMLAAEASSWPVLAVQS